MYYYYSNDDLREKISFEHDKLFNHWTKNGKKEGRFPYLINIFGDEFTPKEDYKNSALKYRKIRNVIGSSSVNVLYKNEYDKKAKELISILKSNGFEVSSSNQSKVNVIFSDNDFSWISGSDRSTLFKSKINILITKSKIHSSYYFDEIIEPIPENYITTIKKYLVEQSSVLNTNISNVITTNISNYNWSIPSNNLDKNSNEQNIEIISEETENVEETTSQELKDDSQELKDEDSQELKDKNSQELKDEDSQELKDEDSQELKDDSQELKDDSQELKDDSQELKDDSQELKDEDSQKLKDDSQELKDDYSDVIMKAKEDQEAEETDQTNIKLMDNEVTLKINDVTNNFVEEKNVILVGNLLKNLRINLKNSEKIYMIITCTSYPFGGGESYMLQTMKYAYEEGYKNVWISFNDKFGETYLEDSIEFDKYGLFVKLSGGFSEFRIYEILDRHCPDVVHTQGRNCEIVSEITRKFRIPTIVGYHFWNGLVILGGEVTNRDIRKNVLNHKINNLYLNVSLNPYAIQYVASEFINDVLSDLGSPVIPNVIYPVSDKEYYEAKYNSSAPYITIVNICKLKGAEIVLHLIKNTKIPFQVIQTEPGSSHLDVEIKKAIEHHNKIGIPSLYLYNQKKMSHVYQKTRILLVTSLVDETFCRVAYEGASLGIPILTTGRGYIEYMLPIPEIILPEDKKVWLDKCVSLYNSKEDLERLSQNLLEVFERYSSNINKNSLLKLFKQIPSPNRNIMILTPWADQGLGVQSRTYSKLLMKAGFNVYIFAFLPYSCIDKKHNLRKNENEWLDYTGIYESFNDREHITNMELQQFVNKFGIGKCLIPEICYERIFQVARHLSSLHIKSFAIPNVEIVRKSELNEYDIFHRVLAPSRVLIEKLKFYCHNMAYIGHGVPDNTLGKTVETDVHFLNISGLNGHIRKQTLKIVEAFNIACINCNNIYLTITMEGNIPHEIYTKCKMNPRIKLIPYHLEHHEIIELYKKSHVSIQVSSHEGIGIGFYESISCSTPVITLNMAPHNEIILENITGWIIPCTLKDLPDNDEAIVKGGEFKTVILADKIKQIADNPSKINELILKTSRYFRENFTDQHLINRIIQNL